MPSDDRLGSRAPEIPFRLPADDLLAAPLTGCPLDRSAETRADAAAQAAFLADPTARAMLLWRGKTAFSLSRSGGMAPHDGPRTDWSPLTAALRDASDDPPYFLGRADGEPRFAIDLSPLEDPIAAPIWSDAPPKFIDLRSVSPELPAGEGGTIALAKSMVDWHRTHRRCARCGAATLQAQAGWRRDCPSCGAKHFPRTDPVVIMLIVRGAPGPDQRVVIGRQANWPPRMHSLLAGYVEPGETVEDAVRRETWEEAGVRVGAVRYITSQPWPFPSTLMLGCWAEALTDALTPDLEELEACRWLTRREAAAAIEGAHPEIDAPRLDAIARTLMESWVYGRFDP